MCQRRPADPTDPGDAADLSIMGYLVDGCGFFPRAIGVRRCAGTFAQSSNEINSFLTNAPESLGLR